MGMGRTDRENRNTTKYPECCLQKAATEHQNERYLLPPGKMRLPHHRNGYGHEIEVSEDVHHHDEDGLEVRDGRHAIICKDVSRQMGGGHVLEIMSRTAGRRADLPLVVERDTFEDGNKKASDVRQRHDEESPFDHTFRSLQTGSVMM